MTIPAEGYTEDEEQVYQGGLWEAEPLTPAKPTHRVAPEYGNCMTWTIPQNTVGQPVQILQRQPQRFKAKITINSIGALADLAQTSPPAGSAFTYTNNTGASQTLVGLRALLTTSAAVANRFMNVSIRDASGNTVMSAANGTAVPASATCNYNGYVGASQQNTSGGTWTFPLPQNLVIQPGWQIVIGGTADAGDQISNILLTFAASGTVVLNSRLDPVQGANPQGVSFTTTGSLPDWESQQPLFAICVGGTASISVWDETYAVR